MQVKAQADTADSSEAKEQAKSELEGLKACPTYSQHDLKL